MSTTGEALGRGPRTNLKDEVAQHVRDLILSGTVHAGERIDQDDIAEKVGVSRLPVREALIMLEAEGLVVNIARRGAFVAPLSPDDISDHFEMYGLLAGLAAARVARSDKQPELLATLEDIQRRMRAARDGDELDELNFAFHQAINRAGTSRRLRSVLRMLSNNMPTHFFSRSVERDWQERALDEHEVIIAALRARDDTLASQATAEHFRHTAEQAIHLLQEQGFWSDDRSRSGEA